MGALGDWPNTSRGRGNTQAACLAAAQVGGTLIMATAKQADLLRREKPGCEVQNMTVNRLPTGPVLVDVSVVQALDMEIRDLREKLRLARVDVAFLGGKRGPS